MQTLVPTRWVGTAPKTSTIRLGLGQEAFTCLTCLGGMTEDEYRQKDIELRERNLEIQKNSTKWQTIAAVASAGLTTMAILAGLLAWRSTGKLIVSR